MDVLEEKAREAMASLGARRPRQRIPDPVREAVLEFARARRDAGISWAAIAQAVGLSTSVLMRWSARASKHHHSRGRIVAVEVVEDPTRVAGLGTLSLVAGNYRIEGLDAAAAADLLRRLA